MLNDFYDDSEPIVNFETFYGPRKNLVEKCLVIFSKVIYDHMLEEYECEQIAEIGACNGAIPVMAFEHNGEKVAFYLTMIGSALAGGTVAEASHLTGASKFVMFGSCGSLDAEKTTGKFILPTEAYRGEGLSYYYAKAQDYIKVKNSDKLAEIFAEINVPFVQGRIWTTDSMLRETVNLVNKRKSEGCIAVEMEVAGVQAVCDFYGYELYDFLAAGDVLVEGDYQVEGLADANHNLDKLQIALKILERI
ncbi:phosphorylase [Butyrivibrio sp. CB08]|uniref:nucleoside phosphorylase n=1 Tax=Butyrivibrio sp. CB08 TaxID=2364879 RepID=UPI000EA9262A|nr:nucleoside phosphorylase [Butyrivibrio sp. CB08]RKM60330.1 phosphorylase [Butyrivibrio sp. CB08]